MSFDIPPKKVVQPKPKKVAAGPKPVPLHHQQYADWKAKNDSQPVKDSFGGVGTGRAVRPQSVSHVVNQEQLGLFPHTGTGPTRPLEPAEMTPHQFATLPGAWYHGTYHSQLPTPENKLGDPDAAGTHFGSHKAAEERLGSMGYRNEHIRMVDLAERGVKDREQPGAFGQIHVRRISDPDTFENTADTSYRDEGERWRHHGANIFYGNVIEDPGSTSIKVEDMSGMTSHAEAIARTQWSGGRVSPLNQHLFRQYENFRPHGLDQPLPDPRKAGMEESRRGWGFDRTPLGHIDGQMRIRTEDLGLTYRGFDV